MKNIFSRINPIYLITDIAIAGLSHSMIVKRAVSAGVKTVQLRDKRMSKRDLFDEAVIIRKLTIKHNVKFIVNDYFDIAMAVKADGVHLGQDDMPLREARLVAGKKMIIGVSTHSLRQALKARDEGADYIGFGPVFGTATKDAGKPKGVGALKKICDKVDIPVVAIGGISWDNIRYIMDAGAEACAVISAVQSGDIKANIKKLMNALH